VPGDWLDLILIVLAAAFAVAGYRQGFIVGMLSFIGFLGGAAIGAVLSPALARMLVSRANQQALVGIIVVFLAAMIGQLVTSLVGAALRSRITWRPAALVDAAGGAVVSVLSVLLIAWFIGSAVANAPFPTVARQVNSSVVLKGVDKVMPGAAHTMFSDFRQLLASGPYTQVFAALGAEGALTVPPPDPHVVGAAGVRRDRGSIVKIIGVSTACTRQLEGSGFIISPRHVLTNAHVVAGVTGSGTSILLVSKPGRHSLQAKVVLFDPRRDVAVLYVPQLRGRPLHFAARAPPAGSAVVAGYPRNSRALTLRAARVGSESPATAPDIYDKGMVTRSIYSIRAVVQPGNSGGPLLAPSGAVYGVVFAAAVGIKNVGYALTTGEVGAAARLGRHLSRAVSTQTYHCD
jgi:S1-C subfamily serine protease